MYYYDYTNYFSTLISNSNSIINNQENILTLLSVLIFVFVIFFLYIFMRNMISGGEHEK